MSVWCSVNATIRHMLVVVVCWEEIVELLSLFSRSLVCVVSCRLCVRNIPRAVSDDELGKVFSTCMGKGPKPFLVKKV